MKIFSLLLHILQVEQNIVSYQTKKKLNKNMKKNYILSNKEKLFRIFKNVC